MLKRAHRLRCGACYHGVSRELAFIVASEIEKEQIRLQLYLIRPEHRAVVAHLHEPLAFFFNGPCVCGLGHAA